MKLLILSDGLTFKENGAYFAEDAFLHFVDHLRPWFAEIIACVPVEHRPASNEQRNSKQATFEHCRPVLHGANVRVAETTPYYSVARFYRRALPLAWKNTPVLRRAIDQADAVLLRLPAMNSFLLSNMARRRGKPVFTYFVGDERAIASGAGKYKGLSLCAARSVAAMHEWAYRRMVRSSDESFFLSSDLQRRFAGESEHAHFAFTSLVSADDVQMRSRVAWNAPPRLLSVGRLSAEKGLDFAIQAVAALRSQGRCVELTICGEGPDRARLEALTDQLGVRKQVTFSGHVPRGQPLDDQYREADLFLLPSFSEGVPKVLLEAMACGLPALATHVGGVPDIVDHEENGLLIAPRCVESIVSGVCRLWDDLRLRQTIVQGGYDFIREHTAEKQAQRVARIILGARATARLTAVRDAA